jgi:glyceraldehyde-3-phosphate dehydrogenase/erythrose-4-phosphate dehydrogenase
MAVNVAANGYGNIGKRVADAVAKQNDVKLVGVSKTRPNFGPSSRHRKAIRCTLPNDTQPGIKKRIRVCNEQKKERFVTVSVKATLPSRSMVSKRLD